MPDDLTQGGNGSQLRSKTEHFVDKTIDKAELGLERARVGAHSAVAATDDALDQARTYITDNARTRPLATAATAVGVGLILGMLISRR
jgi:ElaB/YqjD/DUF883 family membrane-anchored ribosome-binding protein